MGKQYEHLTAPLRVGPLTFKNRMISAPTSLPHLNFDGTLNKDCIALYEEKAKGGCAVVTVGESIVRIADGKSHPRQIPLDNPDVGTGLVQLADAIHAHGAYASIELSHGGGLCPPPFIPGKDPVGPSEIIKDKEGTCGFPSPFNSRVHALSIPEIEEIAAAFGRAAAYVKHCGFDMCMVHGGHGWLLHQFLSEKTNRRTDEFGGSLENRARFSLLVIENIRKAAGPDFPIEFRMSGSERTDWGYDIDTGIAFAKLLDGKVDLIHVSAGTQESPYSEALMHPTAFQKHGENTRYAAEIKKHVRTPVVTVGALSDPDKMEEILASGGADVLAMGRQLMADPYFPKKISHGKPESIVPCMRCHECMQSMIHTQTIRCTVNPKIGRELEESLRPPAAEKKNVLIAGGGPGGMAAAVYAAGRGHTVTLCEREDHLGGALSFADGVDFKSGLRRYENWLLREVEKSNITVRLNTEVTPALVRDQNPDALFLALGADPVLPPIPGIDAGNVIFGRDLTPDTQIGKRVVIIGGGLIGCETGVHLAAKGHEVTILEMTPDVAPEAPHYHRIALMEELKRAAVRTQTRCLAVTGEGVRAACPDGTEELIPADTVILAAGMKARRDEVDALRGIAAETVVIGDCSRAGKILQAVRNGYDAAMDL